MDSILNQTFEDFELIVSDDASTDNTLDLVEGKTDPRIRVIRNGTRVGAPRNALRCFSVARGAYVTFFGQDDLMALSNLSEKVDFLEESPTTMGMVFSAVSEISDDGQAVDEYWSQVALKEPLSKVFHTPDGFRYLIDRENIICASSVLTKRECFLAVGEPTTLRLTSDWEMWLRIATTFDIGYLSRKLVTYRWHEQNLTKQFEGSPDQIWQRWQAKKLALDHFEAQSPRWAARCRERVAESYIGEALHFALQAYFDKEMNTGSSYLSMAGRIRRELRPSLDARRRIMNIGMSYYQLARKSGDNETARLLRSWTQRPLGNRVISIFRKLRRPVR